MEDGTVGGASFAKSALVCINDVSQAMHTTPKPSAPISFRCSPAQAITIAEAASALGCSRSELIRDGVLSFAALAREVMATTK